MRTFLWKREVKNVFLVKGGNQVTKITEISKFDFSENKYVLESMEFEHYKYLEGGADNE